MQATKTLDEVLAAARKSSAAKLAGIKPKSSIKPLPPPLTEDEKALIEEAAKLGAEWRKHANIATFTFTAHHDFAPHH